MRFDLDGLFDDPDDEDDVDADAERAADTWATDPRQPVEPRHVPAADELRIPELPDDPTRGPNDPTPEQIRQWCWLFQSEWNAKQRRDRVCGGAPGWDVPAVRSGARVSNDDDQDYSGGGDV